LHGSIKEALALLGKLLVTTIRPPLVKLPAHEIERL